MEGLYVLDFLTLSPFVRYVNDCQPSRRSREVTHRKQGQRYETRLRTCCLHGPRPPTVTSKHLHYYDLLSSPVLIVSRCPTTWTTRTTRQNRVVVKLVNVAIFVAVCNDYIVKKYTDLTTLIYSTLKSFYDSEIQVKTYFKMEV